MKTITGISGLLLLLLGSVGTLVSLVVIFDPVGTQMADEGDPFGAPRSLLSSLLILLLYLVVCGVGAFLTWSSVRKPRASA